MSERISRISRRSFLTGTVIIGATTAIALTHTPASGVTAAEKQAEAAAALNSLNALQERLDKASADYFTALQEHDDAKQKMDEAQAHIDETNGKISEVQLKLGDRVRTMYRSGSLTFIDLLLGATSFQAFTSNWDLLGDMNQNDADMVQQSKDLRAEIEAQKAEYANQEQIASMKADEANSVKSEAEQLVQQQQQIYDNLSAEAAQLLEQERIAREQAEAAAAAARAEAERRAAAAAASQNSNGGSGGSGSRGNTSSSNHSSTGSSNSGGGSSSNGSSSGNSSSGGGSSSHNSAPSYNSSTGNGIVDRAYQWLGNASYVWGACSPGAFDCSGFVSYCLTGQYSRVGTTYTFMGWPQVSNPQPGDVCTNSSHCGIYIGGGQMIHASSPSVGVIQSGVYSSMIYVRPPW